MHRKLSRAKRTREHRVRSVADKHETTTTPCRDRFAVEKGPPLNVGRFPTRLSMDGI
jgi:hypothetical protein